MTLATRQVFAAVGAVFVTATISLLIERAAIRRQGVALIKESMRSTLLGAENARQTMSEMWQKGTFDIARLGSEVATGSDFRATAIFNAVPVMAAAKSIGEVARVQGYEFRVPATNPRNPANQPTEQEKLILQALAGDVSGEYFAVDEARREIILARTIQLTKDCMFCHGEASLSPRKDGRDVLGFPMEGWREGEAHGAFVLRASTDRVDAVVWAGTKEVALWLTPLSLVIGGLAYWITRRGRRELWGLLEGVLQCTGRVALTSKQIAESSLALAEGVNRQAASLQQSGSSSRELQKCTERSTASCEKAVELAAHSDQEVTGAKSTLDGMERAMEGIAESSEKIRKIIAVIDGLAFQTNILALNAAVEAARAGEAGLGFAVVADEVRSLAQRSAQAARDTSALIEESIRQGGRGGDQLLEVKGAFESLTTEFDRIRGAVVAVRDAGVAQMEEIGTILRAVRVLEGEATATSSHAEEGAAVAHLLDEEAQLLKVAVHRLRELAR